MLNTNKSAKINNGSKNIAITKSPKESCTKPAVHSDVSEQKNNESTPKQQVKLHGMLKNYSSQLENLDEDNANIMLNNSIFKIDDNKPYAKKIYNSYTTEYEDVTISPENPEIGFVSQIWANLSVEKRIQLCNWQAKKICKQCALPEITYKTVFNKNLEKAFIACAFDSNEMSVSLDTLSSNFSNSGLLYYAVINHELKHIYDNQILKNKPFKTDCCFGFNVEQSKKQIKEGVFTAVPYKFLTQVLSPTQKRYGIFGEAYLKYMDNILYYRSPKENAAFIISKQKLTEIFENKELRPYISAEDKREYQKELEMLKNYLKLAENHFDYNNFETAVRQYIFSFYSPELLPIEVRGNLKNERLQLYKKIDYELETIMDYEYQKLIEELKHFFTKEVGDIQNFELYRDTISFNHNDEKYNVKIKKFKRYINGAVDMRVDYITEQFPDKKLGKNLREYFAEVYKDERQFIQKNNLNLPSFKDFRREKILNMSYSEIANSGIELEL
jgi:hypothetical protein